MTFHNATDDFISAGPGNLSDWMTTMAMAEERNFKKLFAINDEEEVFAINDEEDGHSLHLVLKFETIVHVLDFA